MHQLFFTDFIKNRSIQIFFALCLLFDLITNISIKHALILFGMPYTMSIILYSLATPSKSLAKARISAQYRKKNKNS